MNLTVIENTEPAKLPVVMDHFEFTLEPAEVAAFQVLDAELAEFNQAMRRNSRDTIRQNYRAEIDSFVKSGDPKGIKTLEGIRADWATADERAGEIRTSLKGATKSWAKTRLCPAVVAPLQRVHDQIAGLIENLEGGERASAEAWGVAFQPSPTLKSARELLRRVVVDLDAAKAGTLTAQSPRSLFALSAI